MDGQYRLTASGSEFLAHFQSKGIIVTFFNFRHNSIGISGSIQIIEINMLKENGVDVKEKWRLGNLTDRMYFVLFNNQINAVSALVKSGVLPIR